LAVCFYYGAFKTARFENTPVKGPELSGHLILFEVRIPCTNERKNLAANFFIPAMKFEEWRKGTRVIEGVVDMYASPRALLIRTDNGLTTEVTTRMSGEELKLAGIERGSRLKISEAYHQRYDFGPFSPVVTTITKL